MSKYIRPVLIGLVTGFVVAFALGFLYAMIGDRNSSMPVIMGAVFGGITAYLMANLAGTRARPAASAAQKSEALETPPPPGKGRLILYREGFVAKAAGLNISIDGQVVAQLKSPRFTSIIVAPGAHVVSAAFGGLAGPQNNPDQVTVEVPAGGQVALRITMQMGALRNRIAVAPQADWEAARRTLVGMTMTQPDLAEA